MNDDTFFEAGAAFEKKLFGGKIYPLEERLDCAFGLAVGPYPVPPPDGDPPAMYHSVPMQDVAKYQQQAFWDQEFDLTRTDHFLVRRDNTNAKSIGFTHINNVIWDDEMTDRCPDEMIDDYEDNADEAGFRRTMDGGIVKVRRKKTHSTHGGKHRSKGKHRSHHKSKSNAPDSSHKQSTSESTRRPSTTLTNPRPLHQYKVGKASTKKKGTETDMTQGKTRNALEQIKESLETEKAEERASKGKGKSRQP